MSVLLHNLQSCLLFTALQYRGLRLVPRSLRCLACNHRKRYVQYLLHVLRYTAAQVAPQWPFDNTCLSISHLIDSNTSSHLYLTCDTAAAISAPWTKYHSLLTGTRHEITTAVHIEFDVTTMLGRPCIVISVRRQLSRRIWTSLALDS